LERLLLAIMDISAFAISLADRPRAGHLGHQCSQTPGRPSLHLNSTLSQTSVTVKFCYSFSLGSLARDLECATAGQYAPGDACELVGERHGQDVVMQPLLCCLDPGL